jgi:integrase
VVDPALASRILQAVAGTSMELPAVVAIGTGMRRGEILALRWADLDPGFTVAQVRRSLQVSGEGMHFVEPKTRRSRSSVALPSFLHPYLVRQKEDQQDRRGACSSWVDLDLVIDAGDGRPLNPDTLSSGWYRFLKKSGLPHIRFHDLRHAHATLMLLQGVHPKSGVRAPGPPQRADHPGHLFPSPSHHADRGAPATAPVSSRHAGAHPPSRGLGSSRYRPSGSISDSSGMGCRSQDALSAREHEALEAA